MPGNFTEVNSDTKHITIDIETWDPLLKEMGVSWVKDEGFILGIACKIENEPSVYYPLRHREGNLDIQQVKNYIWNTTMYCYDHNIPVNMHYGYYDLGWLDHEEFMDIARCPTIFDTLNISQLYDNSLSAYSLKALSEHFKTGRKMDVDPENLLSLPITVASKYACNDADITCSLGNFLRSQTIEQSSFKRETKIIPILVMMKKNGIKVDLERLNELEQSFNMKLQQEMSKLIAISPKINIWSGASIELLFRGLGLQVPKTEKGNPSFEQSFLDYMGKTNSTIASLAYARKLYRLKNTFCLGIRNKQYGGIIHPDYFNGKSEYGGAITGRLSSANPNIQQIPSRTEDGMEIRSVFTSKDIAWARFDYSQQEPRLMMHYAVMLKLKDINWWKELYNKEPNTDFYDVLTKATEINDRFVMKTNTLALSYGMGIAHMSDMLGISEELAQNYKTTFFQAVPWLPALKDYVLNKANMYGNVRTIGGRNLKFNSGTLSKAFNYLIQGSAADQTKQAMIDIWEQRRMIPISQIHDELNYNFTEEDLENGSKIYIEELMQDAFKLEIPSKIDFSLGLNWKEACENK